MGKNVLVAVADTGGWNAILPVLRLAADDGCSIATLFVGACAQKYAAGQLKTDARFSIASDLTGSYDLAVVGAAQSQEGKQIGSDVAAAMAVPMVVMQDYYGSAGPLLTALQAKGQLENLTLLTVTDDMAKKDIEEKFPAFRRTLVTGGPHFDHVAAMKGTWNGQRTIIREQLGIQPEEKLFLVVGQPNGTAEIATMLEVALGQLPPDISTRVLIRMHPRTTDINKEAMEIFLGNSGYAGFVSVPPDFSLSSDDVLPAADFVLSGYSTTNHFAVLYGMPGVMYVKTPALQADLEHDTGFQVPVEVTAGAAWYVTKPEEITTVVHEVGAAAPSLELATLREKQEDVARYNDGNAAKRVWQAWRTLLG